MFEDEGCVDWFGFIYFYPPLRVQRESKLSWFCIEADTGSGSEFVEKITFLSAYTTTWVLKCVGWSEVYKLYSVGDETAFWGTPAKIEEILESSVPDLIAKRIFHLGRICWIDSTMEVAWFLV